MTKAEVKAKLKERGITLTELAFQSSYSRSFVTQVFRHSQTDAAFLPVRMFEVLQNWKVLDYAREDVVPPSERQEQLLKHLQAASIPKTMREASVLISQLMATKEQS